MKIDSQVVARYYDRSQIFYTIFWSRTALHYGFWYGDTARLSGALANADRFVVDVLGINSGDVVLDAGCGVGGSALHIAKMTGARVEGVTISKRQATIAARRIRSAGLCDSVTVSQQDYGATTFEAHRFTKVFAIESFCHANDKLGVLNEAFRIVRPGGSIAVVDAFLTERSLNGEDEFIYRNAIAGWAVPWLPTVAQSYDLLRRAGYTRPTFHDMQQFIWPSVRRIHRWSVITYPMNAICAKLGFARPNASAYFQKPLFDRGLATYGVFVAHKL
jgi:tocopherol O-methyltransferase